MGKSCAAVDADPGAGSEHASGSTHGQLDPEDQWLKSWAFATSPYGLGISADLSWKLTPREFQALEHVYIDSLEQWGVERAWFANAHFKKEDGSKFHVDDFVNLPFSRRKKKQQRVDAEREKRILLEIQAEEAKHLRLMKANKFDPKLLPVWARMTDEEKRERGLT